MAAQPLVESDRGNPGVKKPLPLPLPLKNPYPQWGYGFLGGRGKGKLGVVGVGVTCRVQARGTGLRGLQVEVSSLKSLCSIPHNMILRTWVCLFHCDVYSK
jgi:hypothetical protein